MSTTELDTVADVEQKPQTQNWRRPYFDVVENDDSFDVKVSVPGVNRDGVDISITGENLSIIAKRAHVDKKGLRVLRQELSEDDFRLNLKLNVPIDEENAQAKVEDGILNLTLPKSAESKTRKIKIS